MIKHPAGLELQKSAPESFAGAPKKHNGTDRHAGHFLAHLAPLKPQKTGTHPSNQKQICEFHDRRGITPVPSIQADGHEAPVGKKSDFQIADLPALTNQVDAPVCGADQLPMLFFTVFANHHTLAVTKTGSADHKAVAVEQTPEVQSLPLAHLEPDPANRKQDSRLLKQDLETAGKKDALPMPTRQTSDPELSKSEGTAKIAQSPAAQTIPLNITPSQPNLMPQAPDLLSAGPAFQAAGEVFTSKDASNSGIRDLTAYSGVGIQNFTVSKSLRVQIDLPEIGKISARIGGAADAIAITLTSSDDKVSPAIAEIHREMQVWLDQANVETPGGAQPADIGFGSPKEYQEDPTDRGHTDRGAATCTTEASPEVLTDLNETAGTQSRSGRHGAGKWRLI